MHNILFLSKTGGFYFFYSFAYFVLFPVCSYDRIRQVPMPYTTAACVFSWINLTFLAKTFQSYWYLPWSFPDRKFPMLADKEWRGEKKTRWKKFCLKVTNSLIHSSDIAFSDIYLARSVYPYIHIPGPETSGPTLSRFDLFYWTWLRSENAGPWL